MDWRIRLATRDRLERQREQRLQRLAQKRRVLDKLPEVRRIYSYNRKRGKVNALPHVKEHS